MVEANKHTGTLKHMTYEEFLRRAESLDLVMSNVLKALDAMGFYEAPHAWFRQ